LIGIRRLIFECAGAKSAEPMGRALRGGQAERAQLSFPDQRKRLREQGLHSAGAMSGISLPLHASINDAGQSYFTIASALAATAGGVDL
jgi:hypothetical protein